MSLPPDEADDAAPEKDRKEGEEPPYPKIGKGGKRSDVLKVRTVLEGWRELTKGRSEKGAGKDAEKER